MDYSSIALLAAAGYTNAILKFPKTTIIALDRDDAVISIAQKKLEKKFKNRFRFYQLKFSQIDKIFKNNVDTIIFDLRFIINSIK